MARLPLLINSALAQPFLTHDEEKTLMTAAGWAPWWQAAGPDDPHWKQRQPAFGSYSLDGRSVQQVSTPFAAHVAGLWQQIPSAAGNEYEFTVEAQAWSSEDTEPGSRLEAGDVNVQIGVDPTGGLDPASPLIKWSETTNPISQWELQRLTAAAEASIITLYLKSAPPLPKRQQTIFWRNANLRSIGRHKRNVNIVGVGDTHITVEPERPQPGEWVTVTISAARPHATAALRVTTPENEQADAPRLGRAQDGDRTLWRYRFQPEHDGLYELRFVGDGGARLLALRLLQVAREVQLVPSNAPRQHYRRVYVLLPPTADEKWLLAAARGSFIGRYTIGFSADDAGLGDLEQRHVLAVNPHHWPQVLTEAWFQQHYPGAEFTAVVANNPADLEAWLQNWEMET
jgi:hypothetical protein